MLESITEDLKALLLLLVAAAVIFMATGCAPKYHDYSAFIETPRPLVTATEYRVAPPDALTIYSKRVREIHNNTQTIRPDGRIVLPLLGEMFVAGKTCEEISVEMTALAATYYADADVTVRVSTFASKKIFVFGEVGRAGPYPYDGTNRILTTLSQAQPTRLADPSRVAILRPNENGDLIRRMTVNLDEMVKRGDTALDAVLEEGDIIWVPPNPLARVGLALQQVLLPLQPAAATLRGTETVMSYGQ
jgi:polysaccharide export outer membrane protein